MSLLRLEVWWRLVQRRCSELWLLCGVEAFELYVSLIDYLGVALVEAVAGLVRSDPLFCIQIFLVHQLGQVVIARILMNNRIVI